MNFLEILILIFSFLINFSLSSFNIPQIVTQNDNSIFNKKPIKEIKNFKRYEPEWESLDSRPLPSWYDDAKVGIFLHFGVYSAISYGSEWFWNSWINDKNPDYVNFMKRTQNPSFTYPDFAASFTCELFNATEWAEIFADSGAQYVVITSKHHEGFTLYPSSYSFNWNSVDVGPNRNILKELSDAVRKKSMKFGIYYSLYEWFNRMYLDDKFHAFFKQTYVNNKVWPELQEIIHLFKPEVIWSDGEWEAPDGYWKSKEFLAWLYNDSPVKETVVANDRWGMGILCKHGDFYTCTDRYNPGVLQEHKFENAMTIDKKSWGHRSDAKIEDFYTSEELIKEIITTIAINGNILINVGPTKHGTIEAIFADRLRDMGKWLRINGKGIYGSRPWKYQKEGNSTWFTMKNGEERDSVFIFVIDYPYDTNTIVLKTIGNYIDDKSKVKLLGYDEDIEFQLIDSKSAFEIKFPEKRFIDKAGLFAAWTFEIDIPKKN
ncbi:hypothetical protein PVAND_016311 [Polypedilum vanderplanki]|uniref:Putative alpha-L-fucosidase n=1 Tax=Polypedilum vanderplanki TaxID=319348 RepID=A0A9J6BF85_POLVA|nr:hypothetical protein PVAND_016311 [Polypedilum vanderplanki]